MPLGSHTKQAFVTAGCKGTGVRAGGFPPDTELSHFTSNLHLLVVPGVISWVVCMEDSSVESSHSLHLSCDQSAEFFICVDACPMSL